MSQMRFQGRRAPLIARDRVVESTPTSARHQHRADQPARDPEREPKAEILQDEVPPDEVMAGRVESCRERQHGWQGQPVVEAGLDVQRVPDDFGHARVSHNC